MTSMEYNDIFASFLGYIEDTKLASLDDEDINIVMTEYLRKTLAKPYIRKIFKSITLDDDAQNIEYELSNATDDDGDCDFVKDIIAKGMVVEWLHPIVKRTSLLKQMITSSKESRFFSQSQHLSEMRNLLEDTRIEVRALIRDRGYLYNDYLGDDSNGL